MTVLVFPSALAAAAAFARDARDWGVRTVGASSIPEDPHAPLFDAWQRLPAIGEAAFWPELAGLVQREGIERVFTPHAPSYHLFERELGARLPQLRLVGAGPFQREMGRVEAAFAAAAGSLAAVDGWAGRPTHLPPPLLAAVLAQAERLHGECSAEKMLAFAGIVHDAPPGDAVEIGCLYGKSSYVLNRFAAHAGLGATLAIDPWTLGHSIQRDGSALIQSASGGWDWEVVYRGFVLNMLGCAVPPFNYVRGTAAVAEQGYAAGQAVHTAEFGDTVYAGHVSILHIDGNHDEAAVAEDARLWVPHLAPGGWVVFDDYHWPHGDGPRRVADRTLQAQAARVVRHFVAGGAMFIKLNG